MALTSFFVYTLVLLHSTGFAVIDQWVHEVHYKLYTQKDEFLLQDGNLNQVNTSKKTKFIIHGWGQNIEVPHYIQMKDEFLKNFDYNIVLVDWGKVAKGKYMEVCKRVETVGNRIGTLLATLHQNYSLPLENLHVIGHSLGAQVTGYVARATRKSLGKKLKRITALDAARPLFEVVRAYKCISKKDAEIVDVIHTDAGNMGVKKPVGTVDFFPNQGTAPQPGCLRQDDAVGLVKNLINIVRCSHQMSVLYYTQSIAQKIEGAESPSWEKYTKAKHKKRLTVMMGEHYDVRRAAKGIIIVIYMPCEGTKSLRYVQCGLRVECEKPTRVACATSS